MQQDRYEGNRREEAAEVLNPDQHEHPLVLSSSLEDFICSGCKEMGSKIGYKCKDPDSSSCNFTLHKDCVLLSDTDTDTGHVHPLKKECQLKFRPKPRLPHHCTACRKIWRGYVFESERRDVRLHPLCMKLPRERKFSGHVAHKLRLVANNKVETAYTCNACRTAITYGGWRYECPQKTCKFSLDLWCAKSEIYGLPKHDPFSVAASSSLHPAAINSSLSSAVKYLATATGISALITGGLAEADVGGESGGDSGDGVDGDNG